MLEVATAGSTIIFSTIANAIVKCINIVICAITAAAAAAHAKCGCCGLLICVVLLALLMDEVVRKKCGSKGALERGGKKTSI